MEVALRTVIPLNVLSSLNEDLQSTLLNSVQECSLSGSHGGVKNRKIFYLREACQTLVILQDREPRDILNYVFKLWKLDFVNVEGMMFEEGNEIGDVYLWVEETWFLKFDFYEKISKEVLCKNPHFQTYCNSYPFNQSSIQYVRVLMLCRCEELEHLDLKDLPSLQSLQIMVCPNLSSVTGWEVPTGLASLGIRICDAYLDFPKVRYLLSLRDIVVSGRRSNMPGIPWDLSQFNQCNKLQRLEISEDESLSEVADLETLKELKFLESLALQECSFSSIRGLSGLQALTTLELISCQNLTRVPDLGCLKGLTYLDMSWSSVDNIQGVEELHLLISLDLYWCRSLEWIPFLGHLKALVYLDIRWSGVKGIPSRKDLMNVKSLKWNVE